MHHVYLILFIIPTSEVLHGRSDVHATNHIVLRFNKRELLAIHQPLEALIIRVVKFATIAASSYEEKERGGGYGKRCLKRDACSTPPL